MKIAQDAGSRESGAGGTGSPSPRRVLAIASGGGHWIQLMRLRPVFDVNSTTYVTTIDGLAREAGLASSCLVDDASRRSPVALLRLAFRLLRIVLKVRPHVIVSTGAAPGLVALLIGKCAGCRTVWIDSIANAEELSMSGRIAGRFVDLWLTQWPELARKDGPHFRGSVL